jgi:hypothetical protein
MRWLVLVMLGCSAPSKPVESPHNAAPAAPGLCERARVLRDRHCSPFDDMEPSLLETCSVTESLYIAGAQDCVASDDCTVVQRCLRDVRAHPRPYAGPTTPCAQDTPEIPAGVTDTDASYGRRDATFADSPSSRERPIEVCGMPAQLGYLTRVTCKDGSHPFATRDDADGSRVGNVGPGGRCHRIVDQYQVPCPEQAYDVFIDPYRCPAR